MPRFPLSVPSQEAAARTAWAGAGARSAQGLELRAPSLAAVLAGPVQEGVQSGPEVLAYLLLQTECQRQGEGHSSASTRRTGSLSAPPRRRGSACEPRPDLKKIPKNATGTTSASLTNLEKKHS